MLSLKHFNMKRLHFTLILSIFIMVSSFAQSDNGTNFITNSTSGKLTAKSQCDLIYAKDGKIISSLVKDTLAKTVSYKICNDYGTNATVNGNLYSLENSKIKKIVFSDGLIKYYGISKFKNKKPQSIPDLNFNKSNFIYISGGSNDYSETFTEIGFLKQKTKNFAIGTSLSFMRRPYEYRSYETYEFTGLSSGQYTDQGVFVGTAGYDSFWNGFTYEYFLTNNGPYNATGDYIGSDGGYERQYIDTSIPELNFFSFYVDFKYSLLAKKRIQPFIISSLGGTYMSVGYNSSSSTSDYSDGFEANLRICSGIDFFTKNNNFVFTLLSNFITDSYLSPIIGARISFKL